MPTTIKRPTEAQCQATIVAAARRFGWLVHAERTSRTQSGGWATAIQGDAGFPDLILVRDGVCLAIELKRKPNKVEATQTRWLDKLQQAAVRSMVIWVPEEMDALIAGLE